MTHTTFWNTYAALFAARRCEEWGALWRPEGRFVIAYPLPGMPARLEGRTAIVDTMRPLGAAVASIAITDPVVTSVADGDQCFVEYAIVADVPGKQPYRNQIISKITLQDD
jgi:ketosteroid isomerase-like protein